MNLAEKFAQFFSAENQESHPVDNNDLTLIIDGMNSFIRCFAATKTMNDHGQHVGGITGFLLSIGAIIRLHKPSRVIFIFDGPGGSQRRRQEFSDYKDKSRSMTKLNRQYDFQTLDQEAESRKWQLIRLVAYLNALPVTVRAPNNVEADDAISYAAQYIANEKGGKVIIVSTDKDFLQLVNDTNISVWNPIKHKMYRPDSVKEDYGFHPHNFLLYRALAGDDSDNIPGVHGLKEKTILKHFPELAEAEPKNVEFLFESAARQVDGKKKPPVVLQTLLASRADVERNVKLMRLDEVAMSTTTRIAILDAVDREPNKLDKLRFMQMANEDGLIRAFGHFDSWFQQSFVILTRYKLNDK